MCIKEETTLFSCKHNCYNSWPSQKNNKASKILRKTIFNMFRTSKQTEHRNELHENIIIVQFSYYEYS